MCSMSHLSVRSHHFALSIHVSIGHESRAPTSSTKGLAMSDKCQVLTREQKRSRRKRDVRARTINVSRLSKRELQRGRSLYPTSEHERPSTRADCAEGPRPCPFVSCRHHLYLDVSPTTGAIKLNFPDLEVWEMSYSCALDIADSGGATLEDTGALMNVTRERIRQIEAGAISKLETGRDMAELRGRPDTADRESGAFLTSSGRRVA